MAGEEAADLTMVQVMPVEMAAMEPNGIRLMEAAPAAEEAALWEQWVEMVELAAYMAVAEVVLE